MSDESKLDSKCPNCEKLGKRVAELEARVAELLHRLDSNSSNSSRPPSSDPPWQRPASSKTRSGRKPGGQPGHPGAFRQRLPLARVERIVDYIPNTCGHCQASLAEQKDSPHQESSWHQVAELPDVLAEITEHRGHQRTCSCCGKVTRAEIPAAVREHCTGPKLAATLSYMGGCLHASKRALQEVCETLFDVPLSLGTLSKLDTDTSAALAAPHAEALVAVRAAPVKHVDETGWSKKGKLCWLWLAATASLAVFAIHARRGKAGFKNLLGRAVTGIVCSDRWGVYAKLPFDQRQICWAHLKRDFQKLKEVGGEARKLGNAGLRAVKELFEVWNAWNEKPTERSKLQRQLIEPALALSRALERGRDGPDKKVRRFCNRLLKDYGALWTFADVAGVTPTNITPSAACAPRSYGANAVLVITATKAADSRSGC